MIHLFGVGCRCFQPWGRPHRTRKEPHLITELAHAEEAETTSRDPVDLAALILARLDEDKAQDVIEIDLKGKSSLADQIVIASGRSQRHVAAMADHLLRAIKTAGLGRAQVEGLPQADWVLIDAGDVIVHLFRPEVRAFYNIEKIWSVEPPRPIGAARPAEIEFEDADAEDDEDDNVMGDEAEGEPEHLAAEADGEAPPPELA